MTNLPSAVLTTALMTTSTKTLVVDSNGTAFGNYTRPRLLIPAPPQSYYVEVQLPIGNGGALPSVAYTTAAMVTAVRTLILATSGTLFGFYARIYKIVLLQPQTNFFTGTAAPQAAFSPLVQPGTFTATADPLASFTPGTIIFTADPTASFTGINNAYTSMTFQAPAAPLASFSPVQPPGFLATADPLLTWFPTVAQSEGCASGPGAPAQGSITNAVY